MNLHFVRCTFGVVAMLMVLNVPHDFHVARALYENFHVNKMLMKIVY